MKKNIHPFNRKEYSTGQSVLDKIGIRGRQAMEFAALNLPILPGFILDAEISSNLEGESLSTHLKSFMTTCEKETGKEFGNSENPLLVKIVISPNLAIVNYPALHNFGLTKNTIPGFQKYVGDDFGFHEVLFLLKGVFEIEQKIAELEEDTKREDEITKAIKELSKDMDKKIPVDRQLSVIENYEQFLPEGFFSDAYTQLEITLKRISRMLSLDELDDDDTALLVQPMVYGNYGKDSASGFFFTRNIVTGEDKLDGFFNQNEFNTAETQGKDINDIGSSVQKELYKIGKLVENHFKEIRSIRFTIENKKVWLIDQRPVMTKSTRSDIRTLLDLHKDKNIDDAYLINAIKPGQLNEILHPIIDIASVKSMKSIEGGISGAPGAAIGRVYFSTESLLEAYKESLQKGEDPRTILCMPATFAEDVKAIEVATGVLSTEGGYSAHASVVARQYGKVSLVNQELRINGKKATIGKTSLKEGDVITLNVPHYGDPKIYLGKANLIEPDPKDSGLLDYMEIVKRHIKDFHVRVNADTARDAELALKFGAQGIGLCRTEHMFFHDNRINVFRELIISDTSEKRAKALEKLKKMQTGDFYDILKVMDGKETTIRLLDAPLHEFLPHNKDEMKAFVEYLNKGKSKNKISANSVQQSCDSLKEFNPMLGHRGCRIAVSYPEIYRMQIESIFEAVYKLKKEKVKVHPEIMIPLIMNEDELKLILYGKKIEGQSYTGLIDVEKDVRKKLKIKSGVPYKFGTMIELPASALSAGEIARYAEFFSFGTNDLTQTTLGLSRDDYNSFMPDYTLFDIVEGNPFKDLNRNVKELIATAVRRGRMTRPELIKGLCGEHGAVPENIEFCIETGLNYVSCSVYSVPIAGLAIAQYNIKHSE